MRPRSSPSETYCNSFSLSTYPSSTIGTKAVSKLRYSLYPYFSYQFSLHPVQVTSFSLTTNPNMSFLTIYALYIVDILKEPILFSCFSFNNCHCRHLRNMGFEISRPRSFHDLAVHIVKLELTFIYFVQLMPNISEQYHVVMKTSWCLIWLHHCNILI